MKIFFSNTLQWISKHSILLMIGLCALLISLGAFYWISEQNRWFRSDDKNQQALIDRQQQLDAVYASIATAEHAIVFNAMADNKKTAASNAVATLALEKAGAVWTRYANEEKYKDVISKELAQTIQEKLHLLQQLSADINNSATNSVALSLQIESLNDKLEILRSSINEAQRRIFLQNRQQLKQKLNAYNNKAYAGLIVAILMCCLSFFLHSREVRRRKRISKELWLKNEQLEITLNSISEGLIATNIEGDILFMNAAAETLTGWRISETAGINFEEVYDVLNEATGLPKDSILKNIVSGGKKIAPENNTILCCKGTEQIIINNSGAPIFDYEGNVTGAVVVFSNITEAKKQEQKIKESERKFRTLIESLPQAVYTCNIDGDIEIYNKAAEELWGRKPVLGKDKWHGSLRSYSTDGELIVEDDFLIIRAMKERRPIYGKEFIMERPDGTKRFVLPSPTPLFNERDELTGAVNLLIDITDNKQRESLIRETEEKYKNIIEQASDAIFVYNSTGAILEYNNNVCNLSGFSKEEFTRLNVNDIFTSILDIDTGEYAAMLTGNTITVCRQLKRKDGFLFDMEIKISLLPDHKYLAFGRDITTRLKNEAQMKLAIERYDFLSKATSDCVWDWNIETDKLIYNDAIETMFGYKGCKVNNATQWRKSNIHPNDFEGISIKLKNEFSKRSESIHLEYRYRCADGTYKNILDRAFVLYDDKGTAKRIIGAMQDVSLEKEYEQKLATAIIETQEKERKEISMEMHDNVNQLLSATLLYLGLAAKSIPHEKEVVDLLGNCNNYVNDAIKDIRKLSHRLTPHAMEDVSMREIFEWLLEPMNETNQFAVNLYMNEYDNNLISNTIQTHLYRILQEQLTNIVKYARASQVDVRISVKSCSVEIRIKDDGIGFDSHAPRKGIGLKNINSRAQLLSGTMAINTAPGEGCELLIKIPLSSSLSATG